MIKTLTIINNKNDKTVITLANPAPSGLLITNIDGISAPVGTINMIERTLLNGSVYNGSRSNARNIVLSLRYFEGNTNADSVEEIRHNVYNIFPIGEPVTLIFTTDNREVYFYGYVETNEANIFSEAEGSQVSIICENPYGQGASDVVDAFSGTEAGFEFPFSNESLTEPLIEFGNLYTVYSKMVDSESEVRTGFKTTISFTESVSGVTISNETTGQTMKVSGSFVSGDVLEISTVQGDKYALLNGTNIIGDFYTNSSNDWVELLTGDNYITIRDGSNADMMSSSIVTIEYPMLYMGV